MDLLLKERHECRKQYDKVLITLYGTRHNVFRYEMKFNAQGRKQIKDEKDTSFEMSNEQ